MTLEEFEKFQAELHAEILNIGASKGKEYAHDADRFANFRRLAKQLDLKDYQIGWVYATKHLDSIVSYMKEGKTFSTETIRGRFLDAILYLELIAGMVEDSQATQIRCTCSTKSDAIGKDHDLSCYLLRDRPQKTDPLAEVSCCSCGRKYFTNMNSPYSNALCDSCKERRHVQV